MKNSKAHLALLVVNIIYAISYGYSKDVMESNIPPFAFILIRVLSAAALFWLVALFFPSKKIEKKDYLLLFICGVFGVAGNQLMFFEGLHATSAIHSSVIMVGTPILVLLFSRVFLKEPLNIIKIVGIAFGLTGSVLLITSASTSTSNSSLYGDTLIVLNAAFYGIYLVIVKPLMRKYSPLQVIKWVFTFGLVVVIPFGVNQINGINWDFSAITAWKIFFIIFFMTFVTYLLTIYSLGKVSPVVVSAYIYIQPILATLIALYSANESLSTSVVINGLSIMIGVFLVSLPNKSIKLQKIN